MAQGQLSCGTAAFLVALLGMWVRYLGSQGSYGTRVVVQHRCDDGCGFRHDQRGRGRAR